MADSITQGTLVSFEAKLNSFIQQDQVIANIETEKVTIPVNSPVNGKVVEFFAKEGETVAVGADLCKIDEDAVAPPEDLLKEKQKPSIEKKEETIKKVKSEPVQTVKTIKSENEQQRPLSKESTKEINETINRERMTVTGLGREEYRVPMTRMRTRIAERLKESQQTAASLTTFNEIDMKNLMDLRSKYKDKVLEKHSVKLGFMSAFIKASAIALEEIPQVNARIEGNDIVYSDFADISVAVATPKGLVTPVIKNCEKLSFVEIEKSLIDLSVKARDNKIALEELQGGTFTISNGGVFGSLMGTPIINLPQSAILGMHAIKERAVVIDGKIEIRPMMYVALTYDHRLIDGREAVSFLVKIKEIIEDPRRTLLDI